MNPAAFLLTYNPIYWVWPAHERVTHLHRRWNVGTRRKGISVGDDLYVLQQGTGLRGLIAHGHAGSEVYSDAHWDGVPGHIGNYVDVDWTYIAQDPLISTHELRFAVPDAVWNPRQSGTQVSALAAQQLAS
ncbi:hypothetical protein [Timonella sp. A28]|uniref:hypothetical protein n=1 Tax=Timonella sp. A28 TaxID=3442640 RepID=UPI003EBF2F0E